MSDILTNDAKSRFSHVFGNSDIHGARFVTDSDKSTFQRVIWFALIILSFALLVTFCKSRLDYYYKFPYATSIEVHHDWAPAPAVTICPSTYNHILPVDFNSILNGTNDKDFIGYLYFALDIDMILQEDNSNANVLVLNKNLISLHENLSRYVLVEALMSSGIDISSYDIDRLSSGDNISSYNTDRLNSGDNISSYNTDLLNSDDNISSYDTGLDRGISRSRVSSYTIDTIMERIYNLSDNFTLDFDEYLPEFLLRNGIARSHLECTIYSGRAVENCTEYLRQVFTSYGSCLVLDNINGSKILFKNQDDGTFPFGSTNGINIVPSDDYSSIKEDLVLLIHDRNERGEYLFGAVEYIFAYSEHELKDLKISRIYSSQHLGLPYLASRCSDQPRTTCKAECFAAENQQKCNYFFNTDVEETRNKPLCHRPEVYEKINESHIRNITAKCSRQCPASCSSTHFGFRAPDSKKNEFHNIRFLQLDQNVPYEVYIQNPLYEWDALLAEIGGMMGLFVGASVLTVCYFIEHVAFGIKNVLLRLFPSSVETQN